MGGENSPDKNLDGIELFIKRNKNLNDYSQMNVSEKDITSQRTVLSDYFKAKGHDQEFIDEIL